MRMPTLNAEPTGRPLRRDAAENRERLLDAADRVFAEHGLEAGVDEVAKAAGVGMGTLYRRFPTKQMVLWSARGVVETTLAAAPRAWRRHLELLLAGLRPAGFAGSTELREQPLTDEQAHQIMVGVR